MPQISFFVPCLNEEPNIAGTLEGIIDAANQVGVSYEILVIDDCSTDNTSGVVQQFREAHPDVRICLKRNDRNMGVGRGYVDGAFLTEGEYYMMVCGDNNRARDSIVKIISQCGQADMVIPYFGEGDHRTRFRRMVSSIYTTLVNLLSGHSIRYYNGLILHKRYNVMRWHPDRHGFGLHAELVTRLLDEGASYIEVPIVNEERQAGRSSAFKLDNLLSMAHSLLEIFLRRLRRCLLKR